MTDISPVPSKPYVRVIPLGGLDQFGMNCCLIETQGRLLMFDCGLTFPDQSQHGVDYIIPDWTYVFDNLDRLDGIVLTHGHEDHIGGLPFLLDQIDIPLYGGELTLAMVRRKLIEADIEDVAYNVVHPRDRVEVGPFALEFIHVNHSIPNAMSVAITTPAGRLIFTGDWKLDQTPIGENVLDLQSMARLGEDGVLALLGDSTNVNVPGFSRSETVVVENITQVMHNAKGRVLVAMFSSNVHRAAALTRAAQACGRKVALMGRSLERNFQLATQTGFVADDFQEAFADRAKINKYESKELLILVTGSQAEPRSGLTRLAYGDHHLTALKPDDTVVISARVIPGNETAVNKMLNELSHKGVTIITQRDADIHGSGHAHREEIKLLINLLRPKHVVPMHGDFRVRSCHAELAQQLGAKPMLIGDGDVLQFVQGEGSVIGRAPHGRMAVDGNFLGDLNDVQLRDRNKLAATGVIVASIVVDEEGNLHDGPELAQRGFLADIPESRELMRDATTYARQALTEWGFDPKREHDIAETLRLAVRRFFRKKLDRKPIVLPVVHEL